MLPSPCIATPFCGRSGKEGSCLAKGRHMRFEVKPVWQTERRELPAVRQSFACPPALPQEWGPFLIWAVCSCKALSNLPVSFSAFS